MAIYVEQPRSEKRQQRTPPQPALVDDVDDDDDYLVLKEDTSNAIAKFPLGCRILTVSFKDGFMGVSIGVVKDIFLYLPTKETAYTLDTTTSTTMMDSPTHLMESDLLFAQGTPVWWKDRRGAYKRGIVIGVTLKPEQEHDTAPKRYTVMDLNLGILQYDLSHNVLNYRFQGSGPPPAPVPSMCAPSTKRCKTETTVKALSSKKRTSRGTDYPHKTLPLGGIEMLSGQTKASPIKSSRCLQQDQDADAPPQKKQRVDPPASPAAISNLHIPHGGGLTFKQTVLLRQDHLGRSIFGVADIREATGCQIRFVTKTNGPPHAVIIGRDATTVGIAADKLRDCLALSISETPTKRVSSFAVDIQQIV